MKSSSGLTNLQLELLKVFSLELDDSQLLDIRKLLSDYFAKKATEGIDKLWDENKWDQATIEKWSQEHMRTPYRS